MFGPLLLIRFYELGRLQAGFAQIKVRRLVCRSPVGPLLALRRLAQWRFLYIYAAIEPGFVACVGVNNPVK
jgi:hypothetical protein